MIRGYGAVVDPGRFGWTTQAFVELYTDGRFSGEDVKVAVANHPEVVAAYTVAGDASAILLVRAREHGAPRGAAGAAAREPGDPPLAHGGRAVDADRAALPGRSALCARRRRVAATIASSARSNQPPTTSSTCSKDSAQNSTGW